MPSLDWLSRRERTYNLEIANGDLVLCLFTEGEMSFQLCQRWKYHLNKHGQPPMNYKIHLVVVIIQKS